jgi:hypothetical protein
MKGGSFWDEVVEECQVKCESYAVKRGVELERLCLFGWSYGIRIADDRGKKQRGDLMLSNRLSPVYLRDAHDSLRERMHRLQGDVGFVLANSSMIAWRLALLSPKRLVIEPAVFVCDGLWRYRVSEDDMALVRQLLARVGATPSVYVILQQTTTTVRLDQQQKQTTTTQQQPNKMFWPKAKRECDSAVVRCATRMVEGFSRVFANHEEDNLIVNIKKQTSSALLEIQTSSSAERQKK